MRTVDERDREREIIRLHRNLAPIAVQIFKNLYGILNETVRLWN